MARIRTIKPDFFTSEDIVALSPFARLLYVALWCEADREGRMSWRPATFKLRYFPGDKVGIDALCGELTGRGLVVLYGDALAYIPKFLEHQHINPREAVSVLPIPAGEQPSLPYGKVRGALRDQIIDRDVKCQRCGSADEPEIDHILPQSLGGPSVPDNLRVLCKPCNAGRPTNGAALEADLKRDGLSLGDLLTLYTRVATREHASNLKLHAQVGRKEGKGREDASRHGARLPPDWLPSEILKAWASKERPDLDLANVVEKFRDYWTAKPGRAGVKLDWGATFRNWVRDEKAGRKSQQQAGEVI